MSFEIIFSCSTVFSVLSLLSFCCFDSVAENVSIFLLISATLSSAFLALAFEIRRISSISPNFFLNCVVSSLASRRIWPTIRLTSASVVFSISSALSSESPLCLESWSSKSPLGVSGGVDTAERTPDSSRLLGASFVGDRIDTEAAETLRADLVDREGELALEETPGTSDLIFREVENTLESALLSFLMSAQVRRLPWVDLLFFWVSFAFSNEVFLLERTKSMAIFALRMTTGWLLSGSPIQTAP
mmetsp:Transcript_26633/g.42222  ORF Transcript_26633/g.42222 Transcript_26633/m.42222 type:complete len:245 (+) Transcript_26633:1145-1879(+)